MRRTILLLSTMALTLLVASGVALAVTKIGGPGPNTLRGTNGSDTLIGKGGNDVLYALAGKDNLLGGEGKDWLLTGVSRALGGTKNSAGGPGNDGVAGGLGSDNVLGGKGNDFVLGDKGSDSALGGEGWDLVDGGPGSDNALGGEGRDLIDGWTGTDRMLGGGGGDEIVDGEIDEASKDDVLSGADGNDLLVADNVPAVRDIVSCGGGFDWVLADRKDVVAEDCEKVRVVHGSRAQVLDQEEAFYETLPPSVGEEFFDFEKLAPFPNG